MDGVFMRKIAKLFCTCMILLAVLWCAGVVKDNAQLKDSVIRLHVVAASDSEEDQALKLKVRDAVIDYLQMAMEELPDAQAAKTYLQEQIPKLTQIANGVIREAGVQMQAAVTLAKEAFSTREYDTFTMPAGVYEALRISIGPAEGKNWWCVVFPSLCLPATSEGFSDTAVGAGFSDPLTGALQQEQGYEVRFFLLDCLGWLENLFFRT